VAQVRLQHISKTYDGGVTAVRDVSFDVADGEFVVLVGPSGCGKTTLLRMIAGLEEISGGELSIGGKVVNAVPPKDRDIAMVFQNYALYPHKTVYENMAFSLRLRKFPKVEIDTRVRNAAAVLGIEGLLERKPKALSGGQRQRVAVGRAIVRDPKVFLFDEPLSNLDAQLRGQMRMELLRLHQRLGATMVYVTHDQTEAMTLGDRIVVLKDGAVQQCDTPMAIYTKPASTFVAEFIGSPSINLIAGSIERSASTSLFRSVGGAITCGAPLNSAHWGTVVLGVRPEDLTVCGAGAGDFDATVDVVELLGSDMFVAVTCNEQNLVARCAGDAARPATGSSIGLRLTGARAHWFDGETKLRLE
jgi:multiple sugar transport system ATP-binding protein